MKMSTAFLDGYSSCYNLGFRLEWLQTFSKVFLLINITPWPKIQNSSNQAQSPT